ncbi:hypothetical protein [Streptomyces violascens]|uniref:hypothetical protein n=1 Tax=Streptomyces violascens TaxID=67381 RepID=UPI0036991CBD
MRHGEYRGESRHDSFRLSAAQQRDGTGDVHLGFGAVGVDRLGAQVFQRRIGLGECIGEAADV